MKNLPLPRKTPPENSRKEADRPAAEVIRQLAQKWPSTFVPRNQVREFTGGLYSGGYLANLDSLGAGPEGRFSIGRQTCYSVESLCDWLCARLEG
jgi:hypothetical protein